MKVFVYGTLMRGRGNNVLLTGCNFLGEHIIGGYKLYNAGFPVAAPNTDSAICGELWEIPGEEQEQVVSRLDRLEGNGRMYNRTEVEPETFMYVGNPYFWDHFNKLEDCPNKDGFYRWK